jgi:hypothetical protein
MHFVSWWQEEEEECAVQSAAQNSKALKSHCLEYHWSNTSSSEETPQTPMREVVEIGIDMLIGEMEVDSSSLEQ